MADSTVHALLAAVGRRLWRGRFIAATRLALWGSAALLLAAAAVHLAWPIPPGALLAALALLWALMLIRAAASRPTLPSCALWADRHLGGASAFTTLLETRSGAQPSANAQARQALDRWATAQVPRSLRLLAESETPAPLARPLLSMLVCAALAALVMALPDAAPPARPSAAASSAPLATPAPKPLVDTAASAELSGEIARALRSAASRDEAEPDAAGRASATGSGQSDRRTAGVAAPPGATPPDGRTSVRGASAGLPVDASADAGAVGAAQTGGQGSGRDAGASADQRADVGATRVPQGTMAVQGFDAGSQRSPAQRRADNDQTAAYDEALATPGAAALKAGPPPAAATPPAATESTPLSATETSYVRAWMKASGPHR